MRLKLFWSVLVLLCFFYGLMIRALDSGSRFYLVWFLSGIGFLFLALAVHISLWSMVPLLMKRIFLIFLGAGAAVFVFVEGNILSCFSLQSEPDLDYIIVLGAQVREEGPSASLRYRLDQAILYLTKNPHTLCIVSGGQGYNEPFSEAQGMTDYLVKNGISASRILQEDQSTDTNENIRFSRKLIADPENASVGIITNNFHLYRGLHIAWQQGISQASGIAASSRLLYLPNNMLREFCGVIKDLLQGNMRI